MNLLARDPCVSVLSSALRFSYPATARTKLLSRMLVVYASRAQLDRSQASASVQKGVKEKLKERNGDHASPITHVRAAVRKANQFARTCRAYGGKCVRGVAACRVCVCVHVATVCESTELVANGEGEPSGPSNTPCRGWCLGKATHRPSGPLVLDVLALKIKQLQNIL